MGLANDVYAQIGLVMLVGLLGKNAILIVEFAVQRRLEGVSLQEAAVEGAKLRFRPIQMTSFAFIAGLLPLVVATGAGAIGNRTIGTTGAGGMLVGTVIGVLVIPGLYYLFGQLDGGRNSSRTSRINLLARGSNTKASTDTEHEHEDMKKARSCDSDRLQHAAGSAGLWNSTSSARRSRDQTCRQASMTRPARKTHVSSDSFPNRAIRYLSYNPH